MERPVEHPEGVARVDHPLSAAVERDPESASGVEAARSAADPDFAAPGAVPEADPAAAAARRRTERFPTGAEFRRIVRLERRRRPKGGHQRAGKPGAVRSFRDPAGRAVGGVGVGIGIGTRRVPAPPARS